MPSMQKLWTSGSSVLKQGESLMSTVGVAMSAKLEEVGINKESVTNFVSSTAEKTVQISSSLYQSGTEKFSELKESNSTVADLTEKSKQTFGFLGEKLTTVSSVRLPKNQHVECL